MNNQIAKNTILILLLAFSFNIEAQNKVKRDILETECFYSEVYTAPLNIEFVFTGNPRYVEYFYSDLEKEIKDWFKNTVIEISFKYLDNQKHYQSKVKNNSDVYVFYLEIFNSQVIDEKNGYDRRVKFNFNGYLESNKNSETTFSFNSVVYAIHDINTNNENVANYLFSKLYLR